MVVSEWLSTDRKNLNCFILKLQLHHPVFRLILWNVMFQLALIAVMLACYCLSDSRASQWCPSKQSGIFVRTGRESDIAHPKLEKVQNHQPTNYASPKNVLETKMERIVRILDPHPIPHTQNNSSQDIHTDRGSFEGKGHAEKYFNAENQRRISDPHLLRHFYSLNEEKGDIATLESPLEISLPVRMVEQELRAINEDNAGENAGNHSDANQGSSDPQVLETRAFSQAYQGVKRTLSSVDSFGREYLTNALKTTLGLPSVDRVRYLVGNDYLRPVLERFLPEPRIPIPDNVHDDVGGIFLKLLLSRETGPDILALIKLIARNVRVIREKGRKPKYKMNVICMIVNGRRFFKSDLFSGSSSSGDSSRDGSRGSSTDSSIRRSGSAVTLTGWNNSRSLSRSMDRSLERSLDRSVSGRTQKQLGEVEYDFEDESLTKCRGCSPNAPKTLKALQKYVKAKKPDGFADGAGGLFLKLALFHPEAPLYLNTIKAVVDNVRVERERGRTKCHFHIDFLGFASSPGISPLMADIPGLPGELLRSISHVSSE